MLTKRTVWGTLGVVSMALLAAGTIEILDDWVGDWVTMLWLAGGFVIPFMVGLAWGRGGLGLTGLISGALVGALLVLVPGIGYALMEDPDLVELRLPLLWGLFTPLAMAQGAIAFPVGVTSRRYSG